MDISSVFTVGAMITLGVGAAGVAFYYYRKRNVEKFFNQIYEEVKQVPKQKKNSFLLLMFKESLSASTKKAGQSALANKLRNPKYVEIQLIQMAKILKDTSNVQDKNIKRALDLLTNYQTWEKAKIAREQEEAQTKAC